MLFSTTFIAALAALAVAKPVMLKPRAAVLADTTYDAISISGGTAGNAEEEALAVFSNLDLTDMANVDPADIEFLGAVNDVANDAEKEGFNTAIDAATGDEATALQNGKIKNKVLKLMATKLELEIKAAQGEDTSAKLEEELKKLNNNIALDQEAAGQASTAVAFDATVSGGGGDAGAAADVGAAAAADNAAAKDATADKEDAAATTEDADTEEADASEDDEESSASEEETTSSSADTEETSASSSASSDKCNEKSSASSKDDEDDE